jgi:hypothetical protein
VVEKSGEYVHGLRGALLGAQLHFLGPLSASAFHAFCEILASFRAAVDAPAAVLRSSRSLPDSAHSGCAAQKLPTHGLLFLSPFCHHLIPTFSTTTTQ